MFRGNSENACLRCGDTVYPVDRVGPLKDFSFFHSGCFKCCVCGSRLSLRTYYHSQHDQDDKEVYCMSHVPKPGPGHLDGSAVGIRAALSVPKSVPYVNDQIRGNNSKASSEIETYNDRARPHRRENGASPLFDTPSQQTPKSRPHNFGRFDASALHIAHALKATELQKAYKKEKPMHYYLPKEEQTELEMRHRKEEDLLYQKFAKARAEEEARINAEFREEWERELDKLASKFESIRMKEDPHTAIKLRAKEKEEIERHMTIRRDKRREQTTRKLLEHERAATAALVEKQSKEMMHLISERKREFIQRGGEDDDDEIHGVVDYETYPLQPPPPSPPSSDKRDIYSDPVEFADIDQIAISVAQEDQKTFTDLVRQLVSRCGTDVEKARTIFRWITVKNLNAMDFSEDVRTDTPMGLLRGIKQGTESYHVLFKRLCSYAGLHCVVIKGLSKSAGYQPGVRFTDNRFRNSWNAVFVAGAWRFVQCNWGARHLVNAKERASKSDSLRYEYDDHYFLTDPKEFIFEFFPQQPDWQLLKRPITLTEFEELPFVRSLFFRYGLYFPPGQSGDGVHNSHGEIISHCKAVMTTDSSAGAATVRIGMPPQMEGCLIFHYNLKVYDTEADVFEGVSLKRFVMQSVSPPIVSFRVHAPSSGAFLLDIFANAVTPKEYLTGEPMKFKSVCKVKIDCPSLSTVMVPLPDCASGEWGPAKATRLFGLVPLSHPDPLIFAGRELTIEFRMSRPLTDFMATLHKNGNDEKKLSKYVSQSVRNDEVMFLIGFPEEGQYGLDIYTREIDGNELAGSSGKQLLTHCCKYLINSSKKNVM